MDLLATERVVVPLAAQNLREAGERLIEALVASGASGEPDALRQLVAEALPEDAVSLGGQAYLIHFRTDAVRRLVVALGGNALLRRGEPLTADIQRRRAGQAMDLVARLAEKDDVVLTHGNGPQVGLLALQASAYAEVPPYPLDVLGAETEGMIGYVLEQELRNRLPGRSAVTILTQVVVDKDDPLPIKYLGQRVELEPDADLPQTLVGLDKGPADIAVFDQPLRVRNAGPTGKADRCRRR